jgi:hypothetical protein
MNSKSVFCDVGLASMASHSGLISDRTCSALAVPAAVRFHA